MTLPRCIVPGATYFITRRCAQRAFLLRPDKTVNRVVEYCLAEAAQVTGIVLHTAVVMSNHWHGVLHDPFGRLPEFLERFHKLTARCLNSRLGRTENFWASEKTSVVELLTDDTIIEKMAYVVANPTSAGLVRLPHEWPGLLLSKLGEKRVVRRPDVFFREEGRMPENVVLETKRPGIFNNLEDQQMQRLLDDAIAGMVRSACARLKDLRHTFLGPERVIKQSAFRVPTSPKPIRQLKPRFAARSRAVTDQQHRDTRRSRLCGGLNRASSCRRPGSWLRAAKQRRRGECQDARRPT